MNEHEKLNYIEFSTTNISATKDFFQSVFNWSFEDFGPEYTSFSGQGLDGGFFKSEKTSLTSNGSALVVFYSNDLESTLEKVKKSGATISKSVFSFPGGHRFHFIEPGGNELAAWSDQ